MICAPAFNQKIGNAAHSGVSEVFFLHKTLQVEETTVKEADNWKATPRDNVFLKISNAAPISRWLTDRSDHNRNYNFSMWPDNVPTIICHFRAAIPSVEVS